MFLQLGAGLLMIWMFNWLWMLWEILRHTPNWRDSEVDSDEIVQNFMMNTPIERLQMLQKINEINPLMGMSGVFFLLFAMVI